MMINDDDEENDDKDDITWWYNNMQSFTFTLFFSDKWRLAIYFTVRDYMIKCIIYNFSR